MSKTQEIPAERIVAAAIVQNGIVVALPQPARHGDIIEAIARFSRVEHVDGQQGFVTDKGRFVDRFEARDIARHAGQLLKRASKGPVLFSEDVW